MWVTEFELARLCDMGKENWWCLGGWRCVGEVGRLLLSPATHDGRRLRQAATGDPREREGERNRERECEKERGVGVSGFSDPTCPLPFLFHFSLFLAQLKSFN